MQSKLKKSVVIFYGLLLIATLSAYFVKPKPQLPFPIAAVDEFDFGPINYQSSGADALRTRVDRSYKFAMIMVQSHYVKTNVAALEAIRSWAGENYQHNPEFLHPVTLPPENVTGKSFVGSVIRNLFYYPAKLFDAGAISFIKSRIADFHNGFAFKSFQAAYCDLFGSDFESALLLANYESQRAQAAIPVLFWALIWMLFAVVALWKLNFAGRINRFEKLRKLLGCGWLLASLNYFTAAYFQNDIPYTIAAMIAACVGAYLWCPIKVSFVPEGQMGVFSRYLPSPAVALALWCTCSIIVIQSVAWLYTNMLAGPDPLDLLMGALSGNFLQEPINAKRVITSVLTITWLIIGVWTLILQRLGDVQLVDDAEEQLKALNVYH